MRTGVAAHPDVWKDIWPNTFQFQVTTSVTKTMYLLSGVLVFSYVLFASLHRIPLNAVHMARAEVHAFNKDKPERVSSCGNCLRMRCSEGASSGEEGFMNRIIQSSASTLPSPQPDKRLAQNGVCAKRTQSNVDSLSSEFSEQCA